MFKKNAINLHHQNFLNHPPLVGLRCPEIQKQRKVIMQFQGQLFQYLHFFFQGSHLLMPIETRKIEQVIKNHFFLIKMGIKSNKKKSCNLPIIFFKESYTRIFMSYHSTVFIVLIDNTNVGIRIHEFTLSYLTPEL